MRTEDILLSSFSFRSIFHFDKFSKVHSLLPFYLGENVRKFEKNAGTATLTMFLWITLMIDQCFIKKSDLLLMAEHDWQFRDRNLWTFVKNSSKHFSRKAGNAQNAMSERGLWWNKINTENSKRQPSGTSEFLIDVSWRIAPSHC